MFGPNIYGIGLFLKKTSVNLNRKDLENRFLPIAFQVPTIALSQASARYSNISAFGPLIGLINLNIQCHPPLHIVTQLTLYRSM